MAASPAPAEGPQKIVVKEEDIPDYELARTRNLPPAWQWIVIGATITAVGLAMNQIFAWRFFIGWTLIEAQFLYAVVAIMFAMVFVVFPSHKRQDRNVVPWYDAAMFVASLAVGAYACWYSNDIVDQAWEYAAPLHGQLVALAMWALVLEAGRRTGGWPIFFVVLTLSTYPIYVDLMPEVVSGVPQTPLNTAAFHMFSIESLLGIPMRAFASLVFGFIIFGIALQYTGAGSFFINLAFALLGHVRGGPAKVAVFSSGLFGSMSGGPVTNVLTTGTLTIPAMKRLGFSARYAGGVEACASTGGVLMPPIMGATAFVMANFLQISYVEVALAAAVPSLLYYFGLFVQIDAYSARHGMKGIPKQELQSVGKVMRTGWTYVFVFALLIFMLIHLQQEARAPFYATALLLFINQFDRTHRLTWEKLKKFVFATGFLLAELAGILAAIGLVVGALVSTGMVGTITNDLVFIAGNNTLVLLLMGALTCFILGMGMTVTAAYIFLAIILAPALIKAGLEPLPVHMFLLYWGMLSFITPPVALAAFAGASVAKADPMATGFEAMRLGTIIYFIPFFFVYNPALLLQGSVSEVLVVCATAALGIVLLGGALQGYLIGFGRLPDGPVGLPSRLLIGFGGLTFAAPGGAMTGLTHLQLSAIAFATALLGAAIAWLMRSKRAVSSAPG
ncbi:MAG: TRAP transporter fused permease subunit [Alphaproteobacteria bacterium]|nr:TRAP transporter fused permease subunit [Alphaproteobacteria bacterium]MCW5740833.1 TRAP transporter fused permease subunit [Alphaproteobacteria bacterium]